MNTSGARLIIRHGSSSQQEYELGGEATIFGREAMNDVALYDPEVSRRHAQITFQGGRYIIEDLGSTNGTFVNERRITTPTPLHNGDVIEMGETVSITFQSPVSAMDETVVKPESAMDMDKTVADADDIQAVSPTPQPQYIPPPTAPPAGFQSATPQAATDPYSGPQESLPPPPTRGKNRNRFFLGCGCLVILLVVACAASLFLLDALAPEFLYCDVGGPVFDLFGFSQSCP